MRRVNGEIFGSSYLREKQQKKEEKERENEKEKGYSDGYYVTTGKRKRYSTGGL